MRNYYAVDIAKNSFQVMTVNQKTGKKTNKKIPRSKFVEHILKLGKGLIFMESCSSSQYWARLFEQNGFTVKLIAAQHLKAFLRNKRVKNDERDAEAIYTCGIQPDTKFVRIKTEEEQTVALLHTLRKAYVAQRVEVANRIRGILSEFGIIVACGKASFNNNIQELFEQSENISNIDLKAALSKLFEDYHNLEAREKDLSEKINRLNKDNELVQIALTCPGVGAVTASALVAEVGDAKQFKSGREMAAWTGVVPSQHSTGGHSTLGGITKTGNKYLRYLLSQCANAVMLTAGKHIEKETDNQLDRLVMRLRAQGKPSKKIMIAVANKILRILWSMLTERQVFKNTVDRTELVSEELKLY
ncbi:MAG: IS110 family transposase [Succinivibrio sp.]|nr:IS110 family transposase [Succinivibrio sp.]